MYLNLGGVGGYGAVALGEHLVLQAAGECGDTLALGVGSEVVGIGLLVAGGLVLELAFDYLHGAVACEGGGGAECALCETALELCLAYVG